MAAATTSAPRTNSQDEFLDLWCADEDWVRAEFEAIIEANWDRPGPSHRLVGAVVTDLPVHLHLAEDHVCDPVRQHLAAGAIPDSALAQFLDKLGESPAGPPPGARAEAGEGLGSDL